MGYRVKNTPIWYVKNGQRCLAQPGEVIDVPESEAAGNRNLEAVEDVLPRPPEIPAKSPKGGKR